MNEVHADFHTLSPPLMSVLSGILTCMRHTARPRGARESRESAGGVNELMINPDR